jgi:hypothetical protein
VWNVDICRVASGPQGYEGSWRFYSQEFFMKMVAPKRQEEVNDTASHPRILEYINQPKVRTSDV